MRVGKVNCLWQTAHVVFPDVSPRACSIAAALNVLGEKWALLVVRELALNVHRFDQIQRHTGAPRDILTTRLRRLEDAGVVGKRQYQERPVRFEYHLTPAGDELRPILLAISQWGERWTQQLNGVRWVHTCGHEVDLVHTCEACGEPVTGLDLRAAKRAASEVGG
jgi:DNA-binding HxlR family transcriptional regulator